MDKKKKIIIIVCSILIFLGLGLGLYFIFKPDQDKEAANPEEREVVDSEGVKVKENLSIDSGSELNITEFFENADGLSSNIEIEYLNIDESLEDRKLVFKTLYYDKDGTLVDESTALESGSLKNEYSSKNIIYSIGEYDVKITDIDKDNVYNTKLIVLDKTAPELEVADVEIIEGDKIDIVNFVKSCSDNSLNECSFSLKEEKFDTTVGTHKYNIVAKDESGNETNKEVTLTVNKKNTNSNNTTNSNGNNNSNSSTTGSNANSSNSSNNSSSESSKKEVVSKKDEYGSEEISYKYGVKITTKPLYRITKYSDGSEEKSLISSDVSYDYSTFSGTTSQMKAEASSIASSNSSKYNELLNYVNQYRSEAGVAPLTMASDLNTAATIRAIEMAWSEKFSHTRPNGSSCFTVYDELGLGYNYMGENIAWNYSSTKSVSEGWKNSAGHYANMVSSDFTKIGFGMYTVEGDIYWVQLFGN